MIQPQTCLRVADNSGAKKLMCIRILGSNRRYGHVGDVIIGVVKDATPNLTVKLGVASLTTPIITSPT